MYIMSYAVILNVPCFFWVNALLKLVVPLYLTLPFLSYGPLISLWNPMLLKSNFVGSCCDFVAHDLTSCLGETVRR